jgi:succinate dehydrogenase / fumarate reductase flavoprotein subunit
MQQHRYDVVIVGAGGAGMRAAIEAGRRTRTAVLTKLYPTRSHTGAAQGGMCAALANVEEDTWEWHTFDTVMAGDYLVDQDAAEIMCREAVDAVLDLEKMGLPFSRTADGRIDQRGFGGHTREHGTSPVRRSGFAAGGTGHLILQTLYQQCARHGVEFFNEFYVLDLLFADGADGADGVGGVGGVGGGPNSPVAGVVAYELATGELHVFSAKSVILATGGFGKVFKTTSNAHTLTGDGMGLVLRRGLPLEDLEFYQFHPTGLHKLGILLSEAARVEGGILRASNGERFMERYAPTVKDLAPPDVVARAIYTEVRQGRGCGPHADHVFLDLTHLPREQIDGKLPDVAELARTYLGVDPYTEPVPVHPTAHYAMGGVPTTTASEVLRDNDHIVPGLYAAGEVACVSVHGANRLGTNSLLDINVFGRRAGIAAAAYAADVAAHRGLPEDPAGFVAAMLQRLHSGAGSERVAPIRAALQQTMDDNGSVYRTATSLKQAAADISRLKERYQLVSITDRGKRYNTDLLEAVELGFLLDLAEVLVAGAAARTESRGGHFREDFPHRDDINFMRHTMAYRTGPPEAASPRARVRLDYKPVTVTRYAPMEREY